MTLVVIKLISSLKIGDDWGLLEIKIRVKLVIDYMGESQDVEIGY